MSDNTYADIQVVDKDNNPIKGMQMPDAIAQGMRMQISRVIILNSGGEMLLQKRGPHIMSPNVWAEAAAGHVDFGESFLSTAQRELKEEVGISNVELKKIADLYVEKDTKYGFGRYFEEVFVGSYTGEVKIDDDEVVDFKWVAVDELYKWAKSKPEDFAKGSLNALLLVEDAIKKQ